MADDEAKDEAKPAEDEASRQKSSASHVHCSSATLLIKSREALHGRQVQEQAGGRRQRSRVG